MTVQFLARYFGKADTTVGKGKVEDENTFDEELCKGTFVLGRNAPGYNGESCDE
jgi:hypothetical protein